MDPMYGAIKKKRGLMSEHENMDHPAQNMVEAKGAGKEEPGKDLHGIVASLSDSEKHELKGMLSVDMSQSIIKGGPSSEERGKIAQESSKQDQENSMADQDVPMQSADSDEIAKSMLDSRHMGSNAPTGKPRNLGERMKMGLASKLKAKGKI